MLEGLEEEELEDYVEVNPRIVPLFEIDVIETTGAYATPATTAEEDCNPEMEALIELRRAPDAFDREMEISRRVMASALEEINVGTPNAPRPPLDIEGLAPYRKSIHDRPIAQI